MASSFGFLLVSLSKKAQECACCVTPRVKLSLLFSLGSGLRLFRKHIAETAAQIQRVQWLLREVVKSVIQELRKKQREPRELEQTLECLKVHDLHVKSRSLVSGEQGPKQRQSTSGSPKWHLFGLQEASCCPCTVAMATTVQCLLRACSEEKGGVEGTW